MADCTFASGGKFALTYHAANCSGGLLRAYLDRLVRRGTARGAVVVVASDFFFFFKQKTAYEIQGDWSSDVCSSDLVAGETLTERVVRRGPLAPSEAARVLREIAWALAYAHSQGLVHRDVKPDNIMLEETSGRALGADFGIAGLVRGAAGLHGAGGIGTPCCLSPGQSPGS